MFTAISKGERLIPFSTQTLSAIQQGIAWEANIQELLSIRPGKHEMRNQYPCFDLF